MEILDLLVSIGSVAAFAGIVITAVVKAFRTVIKPMNDRIEKMDELYCKTFLCDYLNEVESGAPKDEILDNVAHEIYDHYTNDLKQNSYIHDRWERVKGNN